MTETNVSFSESKDSYSMMVNAEKECDNLRRKLRAQEVESKKDQALLEQNIEILEAQLQEFKDREQNMTKMNETIMCALNDLNTNEEKDPKMNKTIKELERATDQHHREMQEYRSRTSCHIKYLEKDNKELRDKLAEYELNIKELQFRIEKGSFDTMQRCKELESEKVDLESLVKKYEDEKRQNREMGDFELHLKISELKSTLERQRDDHRKELDHLNVEYDKSLKDLKVIYESERKLLESRLEKTSNLLKKNQVDSEDKAMLVELENMHQAELDHINQGILSLKSQHTEETERLKKQRDEAVERSDKLDTVLKKTKLQMKTSQTLQDQNSKILKEKFDKVKGVMDQGENLLEENKKYKQKVTDLKSQIKQMEVSERNLREMLINKENIIDNLPSESKSRICYESRVFADETQNITNRAKVLNSAELKASPAQAKRLLYNYENDRKNSVSKQINDENFNKQCSDNIPRISTNFLDISAEHNTSGAAARFSFKGNNISRIATRNQTPSKSAYESMIMPQHVPQESYAQRHQSNYRSDVSHPDQEKSMAHDHGIDNFGNEQDIMMGTSQFYQPPPETLKRALFEKYDSEIQERFSASTAMAPTRLDKYEQAYSATDRETQGTVKKHTRKNSDLGTMPINYNEFLKKTERSRLRSMTNGADVSDMNLASERCSIPDIEDKRMCEVQQRTDGDEVKYYNTSRLETEDALKFDLDCFKQIREMNNSHSDHSAKRIHNRRNSAALPERQSSYLDNFDTKSVFLNEIQEYESQQDDSLPTTKNSQLFSALQQNMNSTSQVNGRTDNARPRQEIYNTLNLVSFDYEGNQPRKSVNNTSVVKSQFESDGQGKLEGRLRELEKRVSEMEGKNDGSHSEGRAVQTEFEDLLLELKQAKVDIRAIEEKKGNKEVALKNEIKFLINNLLKAKSNLEKQSEQVNSSKVSKVSSRRSSVDCASLSSSSKISLNLNQVKANLNSINASSINSSVCMADSYNSSHPSLKTVSNNNTLAGIYQKQLMIKEGLLDKMKNAKSSLGEAIENFSKNVRSKSNMRSDGSRNSVSTVGAASSKSHRSNTPIIIRPDENLMAKYGQVNNSINGGSYSRKRIV